MQENNPATEKIKKKVQIKSKQSLQSTQILQKKEQEEEQIREIILQIPSDQKEKNTNIDNKQKDSKKKENKKKPENKKKKEPKKEETENDKYLKEVYKKRILQYEAHINKEQDLSLLQGNDFNIIHRLNLDFWMYDDFEDPEKPLQNIVNFVQQIKNLEALVLDLSEVDLQDAGSLGLFDLFCFNNSQNILLLDLYLSNTGISEKIFDVFCNVFEQGSNLVSLDLQLGNNYFNDFEKMKECFDYLDNVVSLKLFFPHCQISQLTFYRMGTCFENMNELEELTLDLSGNDFDVLEQVPEQLLKSDILLNLDLRLNGCGLNDIGFQVMSYLFRSDKNEEKEIKLKNLTHLTLNLSTNNLTNSTLDETIIHICNSLPSLKFITLDVRNNKSIKQDEAIHLKQKLQKTTIIPKNKQKIEQNKILKFKDVKIHFN